MQFRVILPRQADERVERNTIQGDGKVVVTAGPEARNPFAYEPFTHVRPPTVFYVSYWGKPDENGVGTLERFKIFKTPTGFVEAEPAVGTYSEDGFDLRSYNGSGLVPENLRSHRADVSLAFQSAGGDLQTMLNILNQASADEGGLIEFRRTIAV